MILLLDTNALIWWLAGETSRMRPDAVAAIQSSGNDAVVSVASVWEIEIKRAARSLVVPDGYLDAVEASGFSMLPIQSVDAVRAGRLPPLHRDPFDRMLVAQAIRLDAVLVTRDTALSAYGVPILAA